MSKITLVNNGELAQSIQNHMAGRVDIPAGETVVINLNPTKDITSQAFLKKFYGQYKDLEVEYDIDDYPLDFEQYTVTFNVDGGSSVDAQTVYEGECAVKPEDPTKDEATFGGWFADSGKTEEYDFATPVFEDITIYAKWSTAGNNVNAGKGGVDVVAGAKVTSKDADDAAPKAAKKSAK